MNGDYGRTNHFRPRTLPVLTGAIIVLVAAGLVGIGSVALATRDLNPNLEALPAKDLRLETASDGTTYLRFSTTSWNSGEGPLELVAGEIDRENGKQRVYQRIYADDGSNWDVLAGSFEWHEAHSHFHFEGYALYTLQPVDASGASQRSGSKMTFCVMDTDRINHRLPGAPKRAVYTICGKDIQGMSVGWGDTYKYYLAGQEIDVTGLPAGEYDLTIEIDPKGHLVETNDADNTSTVRIRLDVSQGTVEVLSAGSGPGNGNGGGGGRPIR